MASRFPESAGNVGNAQLVPHFCSADKTHRWDALMMPPLNPGDAWVYVNPDQARCVHCGSPMSEEEPIDV